MVKQTDLSPLDIVPITISNASVFVGRHHRHHRPPLGALYALAVAQGDEIVGVAMVGRPVARGLQDGFTAEVLRVCVLDGHPNACSKLYAASWRAARAIGYRRIVTYTLADETGVSVSAAGWRVVAEVQGRSWSCKSRPRVDRHPLQNKLRWQTGSGGLAAAT